MIGTHTHTGNSVCLYLSSSGTVFKAKRLLCAVFANSGILIKGNSCMERPQAPVFLWLSSLWMHLQGDISGSLAMKAACTVQPVVKHWTCKNCSVFFICRYLSNLCSMCSASKEPFRHPWLRRDPAVDVMIRSSYCLNGSSRSGKDGIPLDWQ